MRFSVYAGVETRHFMAYGPKGVTDIYELLSHWQEANSISLVNDDPPSNAVQVIRGRTKDPPIS